MKKTRSLLTILLAFAVAFSGLPFLSGELESHAAASYIKKLNASAAGETSVKLSWTALTKKQQKKVSGITVFRNGKPIKNLSKKTSSYKDTSLKAGTSYKYQIKTYKTKKVKQWYNKQTKKWQTKKPAKKYRGKSKNVTTYTYSNPSPVKPVTTSKPAQPSVPADTDKPVDPTPVDPVVAEGKVSAPSNVRSTSTLTSITWTWTAESDTTYEFSVENGSAVIFSGSTSKGTISVDNLIPDTSYTLSVIAVKGDKKSSPAKNTAKTTPVTPVSDLRATDVSETTITWAWDGSADSYYILVKAGNSIREFPVNR